MQRSPTERSAPLPESSPPRSVYLHVPFCARHCPYCDFAITVAADGDIAGSLGQRFLDALARELARIPPLGGIRTLYLGGGTPSALRASQLRDLFELLKQHLDLRSLVECTVEANPENLDAERVDCLAAAGVTRLSIGVQASEPAELRLLGRRHTFDQTARAVELARQAGIRCLSLDQIFGLPNQTDAALSSGLARLVSLAPDHVSLYGLTYEPGTPFTRARDRGTLRALSDDRELALYRLCVAELEQAGYARYEISNFARPGARSRHNRVYWRNHPYLGLGPSAVSYIDGVRRKNHPDLQTWSALLLAGEDPTVEREQLAPEDCLRETVMVALRTRAGVRRPHLERRFGAHWAEFDALELSRLVDLGLVDVHQDRLRLTSRGFELADSVCVALL